MLLPSQMAAPLPPPPQSNSCHCSPQLPQWDDPSLSEQTPTLLGLVRSYSVLRRGGQSKQRGRGSTEKNCCVKSMDEVRVRAMREDGGAELNQKWASVNKKGKVNQLEEEKWAGTKRGGIVVPLQGNNGLMDTGANEVIKRRGDMKFTKVLRNEVLLYRSIWKLLFDLNVRSLSALLLQWDKLW